MRQETLTVLVPVANQTMVDDALGRLGGRHGAICRIFATPGLRIHFARVAPIAEDGSSAYGAWLLLESNFDTTTNDPERAREEHAFALAAAGFEVWKEVLRGCKGVSLDSQAALGAAFVEKHVEPTAAYQGHTDRDLSRIRLEQRLREVILDFLTGQPLRSPIAMYNAVRAHVRTQVPTDPLLAGLELETPAPDEPSGQVRSQRLASRLEPWFSNIMPAIIPRLLPLALRRIFDWQNKDTYFDMHRDLVERTPERWARYHEVAATEDHGGQNALTLANPLRDGHGRLHVLRSSHDYIALLAKNYFDAIGQLGGIPTIHFAQWVLIDGDKRLLFLSNYDGSWESYLGDFVDNAAIGLNLAWACTHDYPKTLFLALGGANDEERFKAWSRSYQRPTPVFYSAYPELTITAINNNTWIRCGLHAPGPIDYDAWFRRLT